MLRRLLPCLVLVFVVQIAHASTHAPTDAQDQSICPPPSERPCVALVLGGGGARGAAHIGVLKAIEEQQIPVDLIVGTSIGAFVGGLYATGKSADEIGQLFLQADWSEGYRDNLSRSQIPNRRKRQLDSFPINLDLGLSSEGIKLPKGFLRGQGMKQLMDEMLGAYPRMDSFDELPIAFRAVAADAENGQEVVLGSGDLATAMQTSMSLPGIVRPIEREGRMLVDGGIANNLPVSVAKALGAEIIIAVDIAGHARPKDELGSGISILRQVTGFLSQKNSAEQKALLNGDDILLMPDVSELSLLGFDKSEQGIEQGYKEAAAVFSTHSTIKRLRGLQTSRVINDINTEAVIKKIRLRNKTSLSDEYILSRVGIQEGQSYDQAQLNQAVDRLYGQGTIARINVVLRELPVDASNAASAPSLPQPVELDLDVDEKEWGPGYLDFKLTFEDNFESFSRYQIGASYRLTNLSPYGAEWFSTFEFGTEKYLSTELYWPIKTSGFFLTGSAQLERVVDEYLRNVELSGQVITDEAQVLLGAGWDSWDRLDVIVGAVHRTGRIDLPAVLAEALPFSNLDYDSDGLGLIANYDTFDHASFPSKGVKFQVLVDRTRDQWLEFTGYSTQVDATFNGVASFGPNSFRGQLRYQSALNDDPFALLGTFSLGGFLNLSGTQRNSLSGRHVRFASLVYTYRMLENDFGAIRLPLYLGASLETGNAWADKKDVDFGDLVEASSVFLGWDSPLGPAYLAYGRSSGGDDSFYAYLGIVF